MNENAERWVEALESGDYKQGMERLRPSPDQYCCLGVGCNLYNPKEWCPPFDLRGFMDHISTLPDEVAEWLGIRDQFGHFECTDEIHDLVCQENDGYFPLGVESGLGTSLVSLNDSSISFPIIARIIRMEPPGLFVESE